MNLYILCIIIILFLVSIVFIQPSYLQFALFSNIVVNQAIGSSNNETAFEVGELLHCNNETYI